MDRHALAIDNDKFMLFKQSQRSLGVLKSSGWFRIRQIGFYVEGPYKCGE